MHYQRGDRPSALLQYEKCREVLREELGISPMARTRQLWQAIVEGKPVDDPHARV
jgi:LuxR family transcriptional regulator, maltose regulon positive regulatory protein